MAHTYRSPLPVPLTPTPHPTPHTSHPTPHTSPLDHLIGLHCPTALQKTRDNKKYFPLLYASSLLLPLLWYIPFHVQAREAIDNECT
jgi:hypothetical protein